MFAGSAHSQPIAIDWGRSVHGVQLAITLSNGVITAGATFSLRIQVKNSSTNDESFILTNPSDTFRVSLIDSSGKNYKLTRGVKGHSTFRKLMSKSYRLRPNEIYACVVPLHVDNSIEPGEYKLEARMYILGAEQHDGFELASNLLKVHIN
jgi:hypothetical protein